MELQDKAQAGTIESSDVRVTVEPADDRQIQVDSTVYAQFGEAIEATIEEVLDQLEVDGIKLYADDHGALDCTIRSRVQTAIFRSVKQSEGLPWGTKL
ncbi:MULTISPECIES: citrate lyase acyl carrier protein [Aerococcus]|uniref:Citrate lyase acyl carrier protein n=1 Tax=Aerococcus sanguinicola TaxID=119206 RepID=A0A5N1GL19_9LACT|nr:MULTISPECIES: citrate lyase acyl carrier protein [Aerococcus]KAA9301663.1 citrate lyase acyl carrier protein [Aerococcus sanguinicola]MDK6368925.1 citrate lyase acyl carrier protein [Aerococcus sp. UMB9870]MDK6680263.1 citrate lyase acyl carrier protein [Aerococcus sp. UMB8608]MDK6687262.1 citrate lyase acyl carrier protein [Aerococcus sp. UMB8623]MDK6940359.1 citrate lyase acyl carrier protein [Aerococcus sp. UMB8487]